MHFVFSDMIFLIVETYSTFIPNLVVTWSDNDIMTSPIHLRKTNEIFCHAIYDLIHVFVTLLMLPVVLSLWDISVLAYLYLDTKVLIWFVLVLFPKSHNLLLYKTYNIIKTITHINYLLYSSWTITWNVKWISDDWYLY
jgi:hypothetical protein